MAKVPDTPEDMKRCICGGCPSYPGEGGFYCAEGQSSKEITRLGCVCGNCPIYKDYQLAGGYYCVSGVAK